MYVKTCIAPVNIALIKYWGKRDEELILPINDSISMTLSTDEMCSKTTVAAAEHFKKNMMWLNGESVPFDENSRLMRCVKEIQRLALASCNLRFPINWKLHIASRNNFPTAAGLASSAAGYACLVYTLASLYGVEGVDLSGIARLGSGSACRSLNGGFVRWHAGTAPDGRDSIATMIAPVQHWPELHVLILVVNDSRKKTSSTRGMQRSVETSKLIQHRAEQVVPNRIKSITAAINSRNFAKLAEITMQDSNQFHAIALDTYPPCVYMNDTSHAIANFVHDYNEFAQTTKIAYTFDAGPNACLYLLESDVPEVIEAIKKVFPNNLENSVEYMQGISVPKSQSIEISPLTSANHFEIYPKNLLKFIIHTKVGDGPTELPQEQSLLNMCDGLPISIT